ncbi:hypothetical protein OS493_016579 [Desmophyllum pertusum]|uniref:Uncharacterized protein n=1 Tax=Desmophyllum pertusum TaxID=174260 RepID=A0A9W9ZDN2_9CNID|nr:hypothetical protein OS493_016579 [Desmophyllum pertusum]
MEVDESNGQDELNEVSLQQEAPCTIDAKALEENGGHLSFASTFSADGQVPSLAELSTGVKRKPTDQIDDQVNKHLHLDPETSDGFADLATLVNMSSAVSLAVSQEVNSQTFSTTAIGQWWPTHLSLGTRSSKCNIKFVCSCCSTGSGSADSRVFNHSSNPACCHQRQ